MHCYDETGDKHRGDISVLSLQSVAGPLEHVTTYDPSRGRDRCRSRAVDCHVVVDPGQNEAEAIDVAIRTEVGSLVRISIAQGPCDLVGAPHSWRNAGTEAARHQPDTDLSTAAQCVHTPLVPHPSRLPL